jgi:hypothetical protein
MEEDKGLQLTEDNIELVLDEIRPYLVGETQPLPVLSTFHCMVFEGVFNVYKKV